MIEITIIPCDFHMNELQKGEKITMIKQHGWISILYKEHACPECTIYIKEK